MSGFQYINLKMTAVATEGNSGREIQTGTENRYLVARWYDYIFTIAWIEQRGVVSANRVGDGGRRGYVGSKQQRARRR